MKPSTALILDHEAIILLHRAQDGWRVIGQANPVADDLDDKMRVLRRTALDLAGGKFATKLVIPNSQILYDRLSVAPAQGERLNSEIRAELDGLTPYSVDELAFDWQETTPGQIDIAVVAEETLSEAEDFAEAHRFNPLCFVAIPEGESFQGEAAFGPSSTAHRLLAPGAKVEANAAPIDIKALIEQFDRDQKGLEERAEKAAQAPDADTATPESTSPDAPTFSTRRSVADSDAAQPTAEPLDLKFVAPQLAQNADIGTGATAASVDNGDATGGAPAGTTIGAAPVFASTRNETRAVGVTAEALKIPLYGAPAEQASEGQQDSAEPAKTPAAELSAVMSARRDEALRPANSPLPAPAAPTTTTSARRLSLNAPQPKTRSDEDKGKPLLAIALAAAIAIVGAVGIAWWLRSGEANATLSPEDFEADGARAGVVTTTDPLTLIPPIDESATGNDALAALPASIPSSADAAIEGQANPATPGTSIDLSTLPAITERGIMQLAPDVLPDAEPDRVDRLYVASIDRMIVTQDAIALPAESLGLPDAGFGRQPLPPRPGQSFALDANGRVTPTAAGALTPDGITVFAGQPPVLPAPRPGTSVATTRAALSPERLAQLARIVPVARPEGLAEGTERARNSGLSLAELGTIQPLARPASIEEAAALAANTEPTDQAVVASLVPAARPNNLVAPSAQQTATAASVAPRSQVPSGATVSQAATIDNAIRLRAVNVIGIYGTARQRRALVRLANGRIFMVSVGERLDGGRVAAISDNSLVYVKSGRNITLEVPSG